MTQCDITIGASEVWGATQKGHDVLTPSSRRGSTEVDGHITYRLGEQDTRPWGSWAVVYVGDGFIVKRVTVDPGQRLSLQFHHHRAEDWSIVTGSGRVELAGRPIDVTVGSHVHIPPLATHRITNIGDKTLIFVEIQRGEILDEADIVRLSDDYGR
jgi:mannose-6-phosphate isomerase-like protein (cupin superfamily)